MKVLKTTLWKGIKLSYSNLFRFHTVLWLLFIQSYLNPNTNFLLKLSRSKAWIVQHRSFYRYFVKISETIPHKTQYFSTIYHHICNEFSAFFNRLPCERHLYFGFGNYGYICRGRLRWLWRDWRLQIQYGWRFGGKRRVSRGIIEVFEYVSAWRNEATVAATEYAATKSKTTSWCFSEFLPTKNTLILDAQNG